MDSSLCLCALACAFHGLSLCRKNWKWRVSFPYRESLTSRTRCVLGEHCGQCRLWMTPLSENQKDLSIAFRAGKNQASPFHLEREDQPSFLGAKTGKAYSTLIGRIIRSSWVFFGWDICSSLSSSFGVLTACSAKCHETQASLCQSLVQVRPTTDTRFLNHSFSLPHGS